MFRFAMNQVESSEAALARVSERIAELLRSGQATPGQIAILSGSGASVGALPGRVAGIITCRSDDMRPDRIICDTVRRFKGLSRPCVFLVDIEGLTDPELIYVATSRANVLLEIAGSPDEIARVMLTAVDAH